MLIRDCFFFHYRIGVAEKTFLDVKNKKEIYIVYIDCI